MDTNRSGGGDGGEQYSAQPPPGRSDEQRGDEDSSGHGQAVGPARQEEVGQGEQAQGQRVVGS